METAWKTAAVEPVIVVILSGQEPSEMVIRALLCRCGTSTVQQASSPQWWQGSICLPLPLSPSLETTIFLGIHVSQMEWAASPTLSIRAPGLLP